MTRTISFDDPDGWVEYAIPESSPPVRLKRLHASGDAVTSLVTFPPGWSRPASGAYTSDEEVVLIDGDLEVSGRRFEAPSWFWFPEHSLRHGSRSASGTLALARFGSAPTWVPGAGEDLAVAHHRLPAETTLLAGVSSFGGPPSGVVDADTEIVDLSARTWTLVGAGERYDDTSAAVFVRRVPAAERSTA